MPLTKTEQDDLTAALLGVIDRYCGADPIDMPLVRELSAEAGRFIEARERGQAVLPVLTPCWVGVDISDRPAEVRVQEVRVQSDG